MGSRAQTLGKDYSPEIGKAPQVLMRVDSHPHLRLVKMCAWQPYCSGTMATPNSIPDVMQRLDYVKDWNYYRKKYCEKYFHLEKYYEKYFRCRKYCVMWDDFRMMTGYCYYIRHEILNRQLNKISERRSIQLYSIRGKGTAIER